MARLEEVLGAYRAGKRIRRKSWDFGDVFPDDYDLGGADLKADDWEVAPDPVEPVMGREVVSDIVAHPAAHFIDREIKRLALHYLRLLDVAEAAEEALGHPPLVLDELRRKLRAAGFLGEGGEG